MNLAINWKESFDTYATTQISLKNTMLIKGSQTKDGILYDSIDTKGPEYEVYRHRK